MDFLIHGLTDPRVAAETSPFDRPTLHGGALPVLAFSSASTLQWPVLEGVQRSNLYRGACRACAAAAATGPVRAVAIDPAFQDAEAPEPGQGFFYLKSVVDRSGAERGLGTDGAGVPRTVLVSCPGP
jgi:hypothetical protein